MKANELIVLSYINKFHRVDLYEIQKVVNEPLVQLADCICNLYERGYFSPEEQENTLCITDKVKVEQVQSWNIWVKDKENDFDGKMIYEGEYNDFGMPKIDNVNQLNELLNLESVDLNAYHLFCKYRDDKERTICAPSVKLKERQRWIVRNILDKVPMGSCVHGFVKGKSIKTNAEPHVRKKEILCLDIENFFPSITIEQVRTVFMMLGYSEPVTNKLCEICTYAGRLPQGAPTSPALSNIVFQRIDAELLRLVEKEGLTYTRYADDLTFSTNDSNIEKYIVEVKEILGKEGFLINEKKTHVMKDNYRKIVTGLLVNDRLRVPNAYKKKLRQEIYYCNKYGISQHLRAIGRDDAVNFREYLYGKAYYINMIEQDEGQYFLKQLDELFKLEYQ